MPIALAIARPVQWVAWCGGAVHVNATTRAVVSAAIGALPGLGVLSRSKPSTPLHMFSRPGAVGHHCCQMLALRSAQNNAYLLCHGPIPPSHAPVWHIL